MKQVNFPPEIERSDINASTLVTKVEKAIQKRVQRLGVHKDNLTAFPNKTEVQTKFLGFKLVLCFMFWTLRF